MSYFTIPRELPKLPAGRDIIMFLHETFLRWLPQSDAAGSKGDKFPQYSAYRSSIYVASTIVTRISRGGLSSTYTTALRL